jgi:hypothetical protein
MAQWAISLGHLADWRAEFRAIDPSEHCRDCPLLTGAA